MARQRSSDASAAAALRRSQVGRDRAHRARAIVIYFGFTKDIPFTHGLTSSRRSFESRRTCPARSPVRIAGRQRRQGHEGRAHGRPTRPVVTMEIDDEALPIHKDATLKIRPRIFLEGNFFVDLKPGTPRRRARRRRRPIPVTQTAAPVQLDEVLTSLQTDTRAGPPGAAPGLRRRAQRRADAGEDADQEPDAGRDGAESLNDVARLRAPSAARHRDRQRGAARHRAARPRRARSRASARSRRRSRRNEEQLKDLVTNFNRTMAAFAAEAGQPQATIRAAARRLAQANPAFDALNAAFPPTRAFAREILPGVRETPATIDASFPWIAPDAGAVSPAELQGLANDLRPRRRPRQADRRLDRPAAAGRRRQPLPDRERACRRATSRSTDGPLPARTGVENYKEFWHSDGRARRREPELRRQRPVHALPAGRRRRRRCHTGDTRLGGRAVVRRTRLAAASAAAEVPGAQAAAVQRRDVAVPQRTTLAASARTTNAVPGRRRHEARDPQAPARLHRDPRPGAHRRGRRRATSCPTSASTCRSGCR